MYNPMISAPMYNIAIVAVLFRIAIVFLSPLVVLVLKSIRRRSILGNDLGISFFL